MLPKCSKYDILAIGDDEVSRTGNLRARLIKVGPGNGKYIRHDVSFSESTRVTHSLKLLQALQPKVGYRTTKFLFVKCIGKIQEFKAVN